jgi:hypothetical protein
MEKFMTKKTLIRKRKRLIAVGMSTENTKCITKSRKTISKQV